MEQTDKEKTIANAEIHLNDAGIFADMFISSSHYYAVVQFFDMTQMQDDLIKAWDQEKANKQVYIDQLNGSTTTILELRERLEKVEKENEQLTQWHRDWVSGKWVKEQTANIDRLIKENERLRERLEKVEKALKEARDVLVMASLIDKTSTCMDAVNEIDQLLTKEG